MALSRGIEEPTENLNERHTDHQLESALVSFLDPARHLNANLVQPEIASEDALDLGLDTANQSIDSARSTKAAVPPLNIQKLDRSKIKWYIGSNRKKPAKNDLESLPALNLVKEFISVYNETNEKRNKYVISSEQPYEDDSCLQISYKLRKLVISRIERAVASKPESTIFSNYIFFFFFKHSNRTRQNIFAATTSEAWEVVRLCGDPTFPIKIIDRVSSPDKIISMERRHLFENIVQKRIKIRDIKKEVHYTSSLLFLVLNLVSEIDVSKKRGAELSNLLKRVTETLSDEETENNEELQFSDVSNNSEDGSRQGQSAKISNEQSECPSPLRKKNKSESTVTAKEHKISLNVKITIAGSVRILKKIPVENFMPITIEIIKLFNSCLFDTTEVDKKFDFLHFFEISRELRSRLDNALIENIFNRFQSGEQVHVDVQHAYYSDYFLADKYEIQVISNKRFINIGSKAPDIDQIVEEISTTDLETFTKRMKNGKLRFYPINKNRITGPIISYLEGELFYQGVHYFKIRKTWYQIHVDYLSLLQENFEKIMDKLFIQTDEEGRLPNIWYKNNVTEENIKKILNYGSGIRSFMNQLQEVCVCYVSESIVMQNELIGEILKNNTIKKYKNEIETVLKGLSNSCSEEAFRQELKKSIPNDSEVLVIWGELTRERKIIREITNKTIQRNKENINNAKAKKFVANPFPYPLKKDLSKKFGSQGEKQYKVLRNYLYELCVPHQSEEDYNRSYVVDSFACDSNDHRDYIVFDQILPDGIESCDIFRHTEHTLYLYHVKEELGQHTREVCSQIINAAINIHEALRTNQADNYLERLWNFATEKTQEKWRQVTKFRLEQIGKEEFMNMFRKNDIVFVYAYRKPFGFKKSCDRDKLPEHVNTKCKDLAFINERGYLTSKFFHSGKKDFTREMSQDSKLEKTYCEAVFDKLKNRQFSESTIAKMEVIRFAENLINFPNRFDFKICEIPNNEQPKYS